MRKKNIRIIHFNEIDSTNIYAKEHYQNLPSGTAVTADTQLFGKGQFGRIWSSPRGNIYSTLIYKTKEKFKYPQFLSQIVGLAIYLFISSIISNDIQLNKQQSGEKLNKERQESDKNAYLDENNYQIYKIANSFLDEISEFEIKSKSKKTSLDNIIEKVEKNYGISFQNEHLTIKWANDILIEKQKCCGILIEHIDNTLIAGYGINLNVNPADSSVVNQKTTSLKDFTNINFDNTIFNELVSELIFYFIKLFETYGLSFFWSFWKKLNILNGKECLFLELDNYNKVKNLKKSKIIQAENSIATFSIKLFDDDKIIKTELNNIVIN
jgi:biotin-(acetyl-CoA carboxylase) ligase